MAIIRKNELLRILKESMEIEVDYEEGYFGNSINVTIKFDNETVCKATEILPIGRNRD